MGYKHETNWKGVFSDNMDGSLSRTLYMLKRPCQSLNYIAYIFIKTIIQDYD